MKIFPGLSAFFLFIAFANTGRTQLAISTGNTVDYYVQNVLLGPGIEALNISYNSGTALQVSPNVGRFDCIDCVLGMQSGLIIATGKAEVAEGPNDFGGTDDMTYNYDTLIYDPDISAIAGENAAMYDWAIIEFDFVAQGDTVRLDYIWGSDEYMEYVLQPFNDAFGFFISGPGINGDYSNNGENIAVIPGTSIPITIDSLNLDVNSEFYIFNGNGYGEPEDLPFMEDDYFIQYDGFTVPMTAFQRVECGETYHIRIICTDVADPLVDSGIFLRERGFYANQAGLDTQVLGDHLPVFLNGNTLLEDCVNGQLVVYPPEDIVEPVWISLEITGTAQNGIDYSSIPDHVLVSPGEPVTFPVNPFPDSITEGLESIVIHYVSEDGCAATVSFLIEDYSNLSLSVTDVVICPGENAIAFPEVSNGAPAYSYSWSSGEETSSVVYGAGDEGNYSLTVNDFCGKSTTDQFQVIEIAPFTGDSAVRACLSEESIPLVTGGWKPYTYEYDNTALELIGNGSVFRPAQEGIYLVTISEQCGASLDIIVEAVDCTIGIPNIFTPNNDKANEFFVIEGIEYFPDSRLQVYNRWGTLIYDDPGYANEWDGNNLPDGVYFYILECTNGQNYEGYVHVVR